MKLNLGCGVHKQAGFVNIDKYDRFEPDLVWDLEKTPWPFPDCSVDQINAHHVLEHLGQQPETFLAIIQELYRVLTPGGIIDVVVPPGHGERFAADPTHVRPIYPQTFMLFSKKRCIEWRGFANTPLADYLDVDFEITSLDIALDEPWKSRYESGEISLDQLNMAIANYNGVYLQVQMTIQKVIETV